MIRSAANSDAPRICGIYNEYVANTTVTFEETPVSASEMKGRIEEVTRDYPWLVCEDKGLVVGYAYGSRWRVRSAYRFSVESAVYVDSKFIGKGIGTGLYQELLLELRKRSFRSVLGCIALPNPASVALHEKLGFEKAGHFKDVGFKFGRWIDVGYWQMLL